MLDSIIEQKMDVIAESIFGTQHDSNQIPITHESGEKLDKLTSDWIRYRLDASGHPIAWVVIVPTTKELAKDFLAGKVTEKEMFDLTIPQEKYSALYLCAAVTVPEYRRRGLAFELFKELLDAISKTEDYILFAWTYTDEGAKLTKKLELALDKEILLRK